MILESPAFVHNEFIPREYTCDGTDHSPPLVWSDIPKNTQSFVLIMDDPDAPMGLWVHWILFNVPPDCHELKLETGIPSNAISAQNSWGKTGYGGPCPPKGTHRYSFKLYALDTSLTLGEHATKKEIETAMQNHIIEQTELIGKYSRSD
ncbi:MULTISPECIES: YbhB/YbcL family Raf kinase inhibitor-like protein [unclassified Legionella]|uniref:YbhB/YbcL family Raf kinase inhibitor-like protein n=1 Tax=Legionella sp. PC997 TaxID=2755562 RepID=UPI0015FAC32D|nr:YbhB/YbcL family Raf kinase inhibitor-like protein [Legionella sp. PC997]QMT60997.1 YbhB/YbcL family Raf kinase inhibitor-like protein [Legionella sp. PC997]